MNTKDEYMLVDLSSFDFEVQTEGKELYKATLNALSDFSKLGYTNDSMVTVNILLRNSEAITKELQKLKRDLEENVVNEENPYLTVEDVAQILRVSEGTVREEIDAGKIKAKKVGNRGQNRILSSELAKYLGVKKVMFTRSNSSSSSKK